MRDKEVDELIEQADLVTPMAIRVAATLRLADSLDQARTPDELAAAVGADPDALDRLMRHLATIGLLRRDDAGGYTRTERGELLCDGHPAGLRADWDVEGVVGRGDLSATALLHSIRTGESAFAAKYGTSCWTDLAADPARAAAFDDARGVAAGIEAPSIVAAYDWGALGDVVDVGGGNGSLLITLLNEFPALRGTVFDLPGAAESARKLIDAAGLADRADAVAGDFFDRVPPGAEGYLLSAVVHNWGDADARRILAHCAEAAGADGAVFVIERVAKPTRTHADLRNLAWFGGKVRDVPELTALAESAGLAEAALHTEGEIAVLELRTA
ncbi:MAG: methyltransferase [Actinophytocola sp.]|uniref:methyltransferase n=1 Tax=Actinophytocola sp. TaxID=1872138 RepID=UPI003D6C45F4